MTWHVIAKDKPGHLKGHDGTSTASVAVPKCGSSKPAVWPPVIQQTVFGNAMGSRHRAQKDGFRIKSLPRDFQDPPRSTELKNWTISNKQVLFPPQETG